jgi:hypothetical protein
LGVNQSKGSVGMIPWVPLLSAIVAAAATLLVTVITLRGQREKLETELAFQRNKLEEELRTQRARLAAEYATEDSAESAIRHLLELHHLPYRTFPMIRHHIGGFQANELRKLLVRSGAVRFMAADGTELWALRDRVAQDYQMSRWKHPESPQNKVDNSMLFPGAFNDPNQC